MSQEPVQIELIEGEYYMIPFKKKFAKSKTMEAFKFNGIDMGGCYCFVSDSCGLLRVAPKAMEIMYPTITSK